MSVAILHFRPEVNLPPRAYLDTNLLLHSRDSFSPRNRAASLCLGELIRQRVELNVSTLVFDERWWSLFKTSYRQLTGQELTSREYKLHAEVWRENWPTVRRITDEILGWPRLHVLESASSAALVRDARDLIEANPLAPRDAFHLAILMRHDIPALVTADTDFDHVRLPEGRHLIVVRF